MDEALLSTDIINEVLQLHDERVRQYTNVLMDAPGMDADIKSIFERIIEEASTCRQELQQHANKDIPGVHGPAAAAMITITNKKGILEDCMAELKLVLRIYSTAVSLSGIGEGLKKLLRKQEDRIKQLYLHVIQFHDAL